LRRCAVESQKYYSVWLPFGRCWFRGLWPREANCRVLNRCEIGTEGGRTLAALLSRGALSALEYISLSGDKHLGNRGVEALLGAVQEVPRTFLRKLDLVNVGMGDEGMAALASAFRGGFIVVAWATLASSRWPRLLTRAGCHGCMISKSM
jgi:hypothetical protein